MKSIYLSVIIPVFNEEKRLFNLTEVVNFLKRQKYTSEIILVDDGSKDKTLELATKISQETPLRIISYPQNHGKGFAIKTGMLQAKGQYCLFLDIDLSTPIETVNKFLEFTQQYSVIVGTRKITGANLIRHQPFFREYMGKCFTLLSQIILGVRVSDFTCGFKLFSQEAASKIFTNLTISRWGFDSEVLFLAYKFRFNVKEIPVTWTNDVDTRVNIFTDSVKSLSELFLIRWNSLVGRYKK